MCSPFMKSSSFRFNSSPMALAVIWTARTAGTGCDHVESWGHGCLSGFTVRLGGPRSGSFY
jgi:hypothetical protein